MENTKLKILQGFNTLAENQDFESITVRHIITQAGVSRATFYRYFKDKYDVMNYNYSEILNRHFRRSRIHRMEDLFRLILEEGKIRRKPLIPLFRSEGANSLYRFIRDYSFNAAKNFYETGDISGSAVQMRKLNEKELMQLQIFAGGSAHFFEDWVKGKYTLSTNEAAAAMAELLPPYLRGDLNDPKKRHPEDA